MKLTNKDIGKILPNETVEFLKENTSERDRAECSSLNKGHSVYTINRIVRGLAPVRAHQIEPINRLIEIAISLKK